MASVLPYHSGSVLDSENAGTNYAIPNFIHFWKAKQMGLTFASKPCLLALCTPYGGHYANISHFDVVVCRSNMDQCSLLK